MSSVPGKRPDTLFLITNHGVTEAKKSCHVGFVLRTKNDTYKVPVLSAILLTDTVLGIQIDQTWSAFSKDTHSLHMSLRERKETIPHGNSCT